MRILPRPCTLRHELFPIFTLSLKLLSNSKKNSLLPQCGCCTQNQGTRCVQQQHLVNWYVPSTTFLLWFLHSLPSDPLLALNIPISNVLILHSCNIQCLICQKQICFFPVLFLGLGRCSAHHLFLLVERHMKFTVLVLPLQHGDGLFVHELTNYFVVHRWIGCPDHWTPQLNIQHSHI